MMAETEPIVFVIDDDPPVRESIMRLVRSIGMRVATFCSAQEFMARGRPDAPACLVLDVPLCNL
jgi:FixJ family two-component response regulator